MNPPGIFEGVRVLELAGGIAGPYAAMFLADHGADVVKAEPDGGDPYRAEAGFQTFNRNKRSVVGDWRPLAQAADVLITATPGQAAELRAFNPGAVIVAMPPWGERGPYRDRPATPDLIHAATGIMWQQCSYADVPVHVVLPVASYGAGVLGALAAASGLYARLAHGSAPTYEASEVAGAAAVQLHEFQPAGRVDERVGSSPLGGKGRIPCYRPFQAGDGRWLFVACGTVRFYERLLALLDRKDLLGHPLLPSPPFGLVDLDAVAFLTPILEDAFASRPRAEWLAALAAADVPAQPVQTREEFLASGLCAANRLDVAVAHPDLGDVRMMGVPLVMEAGPGSVRSPAPRLGEHTDQVRWAPRPPTGPSPTGGAAPGQGGPPLAGVEVVDLSSFIAGPVVSRHLAMLGASAIKVEPPSGDPFRSFGPGFAAWNHGKRSIALDLQSEEGQAIMRRLAARADVLVENFRPGVASRLGADPAELAALNQRLIFLSSPGYGLDADMADKPAFDPLVQALGGLMAAQGGMTSPDSDAEPVFLTVAFHDVVTPLISAFGVAAALYHRERTGAAQHVRTSLAQTTVAVQAAELTRYAGAPAPIVGGFDFPGPSPERTWVEGDGGELRFVHGELSVPICKVGLVNEAIAQENGLTVEHDHPEHGRIVGVGQLIGGAGPPPARGPLLDEHRAEILA
ncbi:MAG: CoA transferase [Acidimicrobiales bacterium]